MDDKRADKQLVVTSIEIADSNEQPFSSVKDLYKLPLIKIIDNYISYYASGDNHTAKAKRYDLRYFLEFLSVALDKPLELLYVKDWTFQLTVDYVSSRLDLGESPATVARRLATLKHFGRTLAERATGFINPAREVKSPKLPLSKPKALTQVEVDALRDVAVPETPGHAAQRDQLLLELLLATGLRADEIRLLKVGQINDNFEWLKDVQTKGKKLRNVYLNSQIRELIADFLPIRNEKLFNTYPELPKLGRRKLGRYPLFLSLKGSDPERPRSFAMAPKTLWRVISKFGKKAAAANESGEIHLHPHLLRHTFAHGLLDSSKDVRLVAQALGHSDVRTTMRYTERTEEELSKAMEAKLKTDNSLIK